MAAAPLAARGSPMVDSLFDASFAPCSPPVDAPSLPEWGNGLTAIKQANAASQCEQDADNGIASMLGAAETDAGLTPSLLCGLDGAPIPLEDLTKAIQALDNVVSDGAKVTAAAVHEGSTTVRLETTDSASHSAMLMLSCADGSTRSLFVKKVTNASVACKPWVDRQRTLKYIRTEARFYAEFAATLASRGVSLVRAPLVLDKTEALGGHEVHEPAGNEPPDSALKDCGVMLFLEPVVGYECTSPLAASRAAVALAAVAKLHAAAWEDRELLSAAAARLQRHGGAFALSVRNPQELSDIKTNWEKFKATFTPLSPDLFARPSVQALGDRLERWSAWVSAQLSPGPDDRFATIVHGDFKAMNVFLPLEAGEQDEAVLFDFANTGIGFGAADVAMHLQHAITPADLEDGGEERLIDSYLAAFAAARGQNAAVEYPREVALKHYQLGVLDYARFVVGSLWAASTPDTMAANANSPNVGLFNRSVEAALGFVARIDRYLEQLEQSSS